MTGAFHNPFVFNKTQQKGVVHAFDSANGGQSKAEKIGYKERLGQAVLEHFRLEAGDVFMGLIEAYDNDFDDDAPSAVFDNLIGESLNDLSDETVKDAENLLIASISDLFSNLGVKDEVIQDMLEDDEDTADSAIEQACKTALSNLPDDEDLDDFIAEFAYTPIDDEEGAFDSANDEGGGLPKPPKKSDDYKVGSTYERGGYKYKAVRAMRNGKITNVLKRVRGQKYKASAEQKAHLDQVRTRAHSKTAVKKMIKSIGMGVNNGLYSKDVASRFKKMTSSLQYKNIK